MPEEVRAPQLPAVNLEAEPLKLGYQAIEDAYALETVKQTFWNYENYRAQNHDPRWNGHDALYVGWVPPRYWEGTSVPRSSLGMPITFAQVESAFPAIYQAIFLDDSWFSVTPEPGADPAEAKAIQSHLKYSLEHPSADYTGNSEMEIELAIKQLLIHGNGGIEVEWDNEAGHPRICWVDLKDLYFDPGSVTPSTDSNRSIIRRKLLTIDQVDDLRHDPRMKIPPRAVLVNMARNSNYVVGDRTKQTSEALRGINYNPAYHEWSPLPAERKIECLIYYSKHRIIWVLNREWIVYNETNPYGFIPFCFAPCFPVPGRFYAMSYADVIENPQRYIEALYNGRLDGLALALRPPRVRKRGAALTPSQQRWSPGSVQEVDNPKDDLAVLTAGGDVSGIMGDVAYLETAVEKLTGVNSVNQSVPKPGNANRTATGMNLQAQGGSARMWPIVKHVEDYMIIPMLYKMYKMIQVHTHPGQLLPALGQDDQRVMVGAQAFRQPVRFSMKASSKMLTREKLAQVVPFLAQFMLNGPFISGINASGQTVDFDVFGQMIQDATGTGSQYRLIRPMNQQEQQAKQTPPPQLVMQQQQAQAEQQTRLQMGQMKGEYDLKKTMLQKQSDPAQAQRDQQKAQMDMVKQLIGVKVDQQKAHIAAQQAQQKMAIDHMTAQQKMAHERQQAQQKLLLEAATGRQQLIQNQQNHQHQMAVQHATAQQQLRQGEVAGRQKLDQTKQLGQHKMQMDKQKFALQARAMARKPAPAKKAA